MNPTPRSLYRARLRACATVASFSLLAPSIQLLRAADGTWSNAAGGAWDTTGNWSGGGVAGGADFAAYFNDVNITAVTTVSLDTPVTLGAIVFGDTTPTADPNSGGNYVNGSTVTPTGGWVLNNGGNAANTLTLDVGTGRPVITVNDLGTMYSAYALVPKTATISAVIAGADGLTKNGVGKLILSGANTFSGGLSVDAGTLTLSGTQAFTGGISVDGASTRLEFGADSNLGSNDISLSGGATLARTGDGGEVGVGKALSVGAGGATVTHGGYTSLGFNFSLSGEGQLTVVSGNSGVTLKGDNSAHTGGYKVTTGGLYFLNAQSLPTVGSILIEAGGALVGGGANTAQGWLDSGRIDVASTGALLLGNPTNTEDVDMTGYAGLYLGATNIITNLGGANTVNYSGTITPDGNTYRFGGGSGSHTFNLVNTNALTGARSAVFGIAGRGNNIVRLSGSNDYSGGSTVNTNVIVAASDALGTGAVSVANGASVRMTGGVSLGNALTLNGVPSDSAIGALHSLAGANTWTGDIALGANSRIVAANTAGNGLELSGDINLGTRALTLTAGSTGTYAGGDILVSGDFTGTGNITKADTSGTVTFAGNNAYGTTTISGGTLKIGAGGAGGTLGTGAVSISSNRSGRLVFDRSDTYSVANAISGAGAVVQQGAGVTVFTGTNKTYTGATTINAGTLRVDGTLTSSSITVNSGARIGGLGTVGTVNFNSGAGLAYDVADVAQSGDGLTASSFTGAGLGEFTVFLTGAATGFDTLEDYSWAVLTATSVAALELANLNVDTSGFGQSFGGTFSLSIIDDSLWVNYAGAAIPEPSSFAILAGGAMLGFVSIRRRRRS